MNSLIMLRMALNHLKEYSSNEWVIEGDKKYNIDTVLSRIKVLNYMTTVKMRLTQRRCRMN